MDFSNFTDINNHQSQSVLEYFLILYPQLIVILSLLYTKTTTLYRLIIIEIELEQVFGVTESFSLSGFKCLFSLQHLAALPSYVQIVFPCRQHDFVYASWRISELFISFCFSIHNWLSSLSMFLCVVFMTLRYIPQSRVIELHGCAFILLNR